MGIESDDWQDVGYHVEVLIEDKFSDSYQDVAAPILGSVVEVDQAWDDRWPR